MVIEAGVTAERQLGATFVVWVMRISRPSNFHVRRGGTFFGSTYRSSNDFPTVRRTHRGGLGKTIASAHTEAHQE